MAPHLSAPHRAASNIYMHVRMYTYLHCMANVPSSGSLGAHAALRHPGGLPACPGLPTQPTLSPSAEGSPCRVGHPNRSGAALWRARWCPAQARSSLTTPNPILNPTLILTLTLTLLQARPAERGLQLSGVPGAHRGGYPPLCHRVVRGARRPAPGAGGARVGAIPTAEMCHVKLSEPAPLSLSMCYILLAFY